MYDVYFSPAEGRFSFQSGVEISVVFFVRRKPIENPIEKTSSLTQNGCNPGIPIAVLSAECVRGMSVHLISREHIIF